MKPLLPASREMTVRHWGAVLGMMAATAFGSVGIAQANDENITRSHGLASYGFAINLHESMVGRV